MFPLRDDNPTLRHSVMTFLLIAANALVWIAVQGMGIEPWLTKSVFSYGIIPGKLLEAIRHWTALPIGPGLEYMLHRRANWEALLTSMFMHGGWFHIIGNMWFLAIFGDNVEDAMGPFVFLFFYVVCGLAAAWAHIFMNPSSALPMVGASGAISGVMGAYVMLYPRAPVHVLVFFGFFFTRIIVPAYLMLGYWFMLQVLCGPDEQKEVKMF